MLNFSEYINTRPAWHLTRYSDSQLAEGQRKERDKTLDMKIALRSHISRVAENAFQKKLIDKMRKELEVLVQEYLTLEKKRFALSELSKELRLSQIQMPQHIMAYWQALDKSMEQCGAEKEALAEKIEAALKLRKEAVMNFVMLDPEFATSDWIYDEKLKLRLYFEE